MKDEPITLSRSLFRAGLVAIGISLLFVLLCLLFKTPPPGEIIY